MTDGPMKNLGNFVTRNGRRRALGCLTLLTATLAVPSANAQQFRLAVDVEQGVLLPKSYALNGIAVPGVDFARLRLAVDIGAAFENPKWSVIAGVRPSVVVWAPVTKETGLRLVTDLSYLSVGAWRWTGGFSVDLDSFHIGFVGGYDSFHDSALFLTTIGADIPTIVAFFAGGPFAAAPPCGAH